MCQKKYKVLILTNSVLEYRLPVYNLLADSFNLTVAHFGKSVDKDRANFNQIILNPKKCGPFTIFKENIKQLASQFDSVIALGDLHLIPFFRLGLIRRRTFSLSYWSIGVSASYNKHFDEDRKFDKIRFKLMNNADSIIFYTEYPIKRYVVDGGIDKNKLFVANNTVEVKEKINIPELKKHFLFVGTLYKEKKIFDLLDAYLIAYNKNHSLQPLVIIGDGRERLNIEKWINEHCLNDKITLTGAIFDQSILKEYYRDAIACVSPGQAGLTVLNSMAYGVPFVTTENAITGGEIFNIVNGVNGIIYKESIDSLSEILLDLSYNLDYVYTMSKNSQEFYFNNRTISVMVKGLKEAVLYAVNKKCN